MSRKLLVPLDGSKASEAVLPWAEALARTSHYSLVLVRVVLGRRYAAEYLTVGVHRQHTMPEWQTATAYLEQVQGRLEARGLDVETTVREGMITENILDVADETGAFAIALSTRGRHGLARFFLGSVAEGLVQDATIPLLLAPAEARRRRETPDFFSRVLIPLDGSERAEEALSYIDSFVPSAAILTLVHVVTPEEQDAAAPSDSLLLDDDASSRVAANARSYLDGVAQRLHGAGKRAYIMTMSGLPAREILLAAHAAQADAIVMTSHGRTGPGRWRLGSVADEVVRNGDRPVLLVSTRALAARSPSHASIREVLTREPAVLHSGDSVALAMRKMLRRPGQSAPVVDSEGRLLGVLAERDLLSWASSAGKEPPSAEELARRAEQSTVADLLSADAITVDESAPVAAAIRAILDQRVDSLPVLRDGRVVGVVTRHDLLTTVAGTSATAPRPSDGEPISAVSNDRAARGRRGHTA